MFLAFGDISFIKDAILTVFVFPDEIMPISENSISLEFMYSVITFERCMVAALIFISPVYELLFTRVTTGIELSEAYSNSS